MGGRAETGGSMNSLLSSWMLFVRSCSSEERLQEKKKKGKANRNRKKMLMLFFETGAISAFFCIRTGIGSRVDEQNLIFCCSVFAMLIAWLIPVT